MKYCSHCGREYVDETLKFCLDDGERLSEQGVESESPTAIKMPEIAAELPSRKRIESADATEGSPGGRPIDRAHGITVMNRNMRNSRLV